jgi:hypothetical protein
MLNQGYSNELSKNEMLDSNAPSADGSMTGMKNMSEEVDSSMNKMSYGKKIGMSQFHAFSKIVCDLDDQDGDDSKCSTQASKNVPSDAKSEKS